MALGNKTLADLLNPISKQLGHAAVPDAVEMPVWEDDPERVTDGMTHEQLVEKFAEEAEKIRVGVHRCTPDGLAACIAGILEAGEPDSGEACGVVCENNPRFEQAGLYDAIRGLNKVSDLHIWESAAGDANVEKARVATYGVTYATAGIAESATVAQPTSADCGRSLSLLPLVHIAVVDAAAIVPTMREVLESYVAQDDKLASQVCFISGPSATADIELVRVEGVHGPMYVHYIIVE